MICTTAGVAEVLGVHYSTAKQMVADGTLPPEAVAGGQPLWRCETVRRWGKTRKPGELPPAPPLEVWSAQELAERFRVSVPAIRKWRDHGLLPEPTWQLPKINLWDSEAVTAMTPTCASCTHPVDITDARSQKGRPTEVLCSCGTWTPMRPKVLA